MPRPPRHTCGRTFCGTAVPDRKKSAERQESGRPRTMSARRRTAVGATRATASRPPPVAAESPAASPLVPDRSVRHSGPQPSGSGEARDKPTAPYRPEKKIPSPGSSTRRRICDRQHAKGLRHDSVTYTASRTIRPPPRTEACSPSAIRFEKGFRRHVLRRTIKRLDRRRPCACKRIANPSDGASARQTAGSSAPKGKRAQARPPEDLRRLKRRRNRIPSRAPHNRVGRPFTCAYESGRRQTTGPPSGTSPRCSERNRRRSQPPFRTAFRRKSCISVTPVPQGTLRCEGRSSELCPVCRFRPRPASRQEPGLRIKRFGRALGDPS